MTEDIELEYRDIKAQFDNLEQLFQVDDEEENLHDLYGFLEQILDLFFELVQKMRMMEYRIKTLEKASKLTDISKEIQEISKKSPPMPGMVGEDYHV
jgi:predicted nucleotidyltransferase